MSANLVQTASPYRVDGRLELTPPSLARVVDVGRRLDVYKRDPGVPTVSVVTRCYNQAQYLPEAVASVLAQTFEDWELIVVDDGSPDDTAQVATALIVCHPARRIRLLRGPNRGLAGALNVGVEASLGRYILPLDADDMIAPTMLEQTVHWLEHDPAVAVVYTDLQQFGEGSELICAPDFDPSTLPDANQLNYCSLYRREVWEAVGGYNVNMTWGYEDWDFWVGAVEKGYRARRIPEPLFLYRVKVEGMYARAVRHDTDLRRQLAINHPRMYTASQRLRRRVGRTVRSVKRRTT